MKQMTSPTKQGRKHNRMVAPNGLQKQWKFWVKINSTTHVTGPPQVQHRSDMNRKHVGEHSRGAREKGVDKGAAQMEKGGRERGE